MSVEGGEDRYQYLTGPGGDNGACFLQWNRNKRSLTLDPLAPDGKEILARLVRTADVVVANLPIETIRQMGVDYGTLRKSRRDIILVHVTAFGPRGPYPVGSVSRRGQAMSEWSISLVFRTSRRILRVVVHCSRLFSAPTRARGNSLDARRQGRLWSQFLRSA